MSYIEVENKRLLQKILSVIKLANIESISKNKEVILKNPMKRKVYELCDSRHTVTDIASELSTTQPNVSQHLATLQESGLVLYEERNGKKFFFKSLE